MSSSGKANVPSLAIIGGGVFGLTAAIEVAQLEIQISVFDRSPKVLQGATKLNNGVIHLGYHYPRSVETVLQSKKGTANFLSRFADCVRSTYNKYYCIASEGSFTSGKDYLE
jgi:D-amino-acid oxidase